MTNPKLYTLERKASLHNSGAYPRDADYGRLTSAIGSALDGTVSNPQRLTTAYIHQIFRNLESGDGKGCFEHVAET
jgi:hypothetical protein